jgi:hypothetical protein
LSFLAEEGGEREEEDVEEVVREEEDEERVLVGMAATASAMCTLLSAAHRASSLFWKGECEDGGGKSKVSLMQTDLYGEQRL